MPADSSKNLQADDVPLSSGARDEALRLPWDAPQDRSEDDEPPAADLETASSYISDPSSSGGWTIPLLCLGIGILTCCLLIPAADENRRLAYERERLRLDLEQIQKQIQTNDEFLKLVADDPTLSERLAQRQMKMVRAGTAILDLGHSGTQMSPFELVTLPPPPELPPYRPIGGAFSSLCRNAHSRLYLMGCGLLLAATGLVLEGSHSRQRDGTG